MMDCRRTRAHRASLRAPLGGAETWRCYRGRRGLSCAGPRKLAQDEFRRRRIPAMQDVAEGRRSKKLFNMSAKRVPEVVGAAAPCGNAPFAFFTGAARHLNGLVHGGHDLGDAYCACVTAQHVTAARS